jgi:peroxiredoxin Q/BCP
MTNPAAVSLQVGDKAPAFSLPAHPSGNIRLADYLGKKNVILAFYPKDDTPGCTKEMCAFSADLSQFNSHNTQVLGISLDGQESHGQFAAKYNLSLPLLADHKGIVASAYGAVTAGKSTAERILFIIDKSGVIRHIHRGMPDNQELLKVVSSLK